SPARPRGAARDRARRRHRTHADGARPLDAARLPVARDRAGRSARRDRGARRAAVRRDRRARGVSRLELDTAAFEALVVEELDALPDDMVDGLDNLVFVVEDRPEDGSLDLLGL